MSFCDFSSTVEGYWQFLGRVDLEGGFFFHAPRQRERLTSEVWGSVIGTDVVRVTKVNQYGNGRVFLAPFPALRWVRGEHGRLRRAHQVCWTILPPVFLHRRATILFRMIADDAP